MNNFMPSPYNNNVHPAPHYFDPRMHPYPCPSPPNMIPLPSFINIEQPHYQQLQEQEQQQNMIDIGNNTPTNGNGNIGTHHFQVNTTDSISLGSSIDSVLSDISCAGSVITENGQRIIENLENILDDNDSNDGSNDTLLSEAETKLYDDSIFFWRSMIWSIVKAKWTQFKNYVRGSSCKIKKCVWHSSTK